MAFTPSKNKKRQNSACNNGTILAFSENQRQSTFHSRRKAPFLPSKTARTAGGSGWAGAEKRQAFLLPFRRSVQNRSVLPFRASCLRLPQSSFSLCCSFCAWRFPQCSRTAAQRPVLGFRWARARLCPENRTQPRHTAHAGGQTFSCCACWNASKRFRMRSCSHSASSFASLCS